MAEEDAGGGETVQYYEKELGWVPPFVIILAKYSPGALDGYLTMRKEVFKEPPEGALPRKTKEMLFTILTTSSSGNGSSHCSRFMDNIRVKTLLYGIFSPIKVPAILVSSSFLHPTGIGLLKLNFGLSFFLWPLERNNNHFSGNSVISPSDKIS